MKYRPHRSIPLLAVAAGAALLCGYTYQSAGVIDWKYFGTAGANAPHTYNPSNGTPTNTEFTRTLPAGLPALPADLMSMVRYSLPEGRDIRQNPQGVLPDSDDKTNIILKEDGDVWVTFLSEGAGYLNSVGFFTYNPASPPKTVAEVSEQIFFANASAPSPLDTADGTRQNTVYLGNFKAGQAIGFMIVSDGFRTNGRTYNGTKIGGVKQTADPKWVFYTLRNLNPEAANARNLNMHTVMLRDDHDASSGYQRLVIGFEDINREVGGDHDFNDVLLAIHVTPGRALANLNALQPLVGADSADTDGDGVKDAMDEYPNDPARAFSRYYPDRNNMGTLAYEDQWPKRGDYDMNDVVMRYRTREVMNASRQVVGLEIDYRMDARGGLFDTSFAVNLPGVSAAAVQAATLAVNSGAAAPVSVEAGQTEATFVVMNSSLAAMPSPNAACSYANTQTGCPAVPSVNYTLKVDFKTPQSLALFSSPYNPFIYRRSTRGQEVHLAGQQPTALADASLFRTLDDTTVKGTTTTYMDASRRPWAMDIPVDWKHPSEVSDLAFAYPNVTEWARTSGSSNRDWYLNPTPSFLYVKP